MAHIHGNKIIRAVIAFMELRINKTNAFIQILHIYLARVCITGIPLKIVDPIEYFINPVQAGGRGAYLPYTMQICLSFFSIKLLVGFQVLTITFYS